MAKAYNTIGTILKFGTTSGSLTKLCKIKSFPALGGSPETIEVTDLEDDFQTFILGVQTVDSMEFTANYTYSDYQSVAANAGKDGYFELDLAHDQGKATWQGQYSVYVNEGEVNGAYEMTITVVPSSKIEISASSTT